MKKTFEVRIREWDKEILRPDIRVFKVTVDMHQMGCKYAAKCLCANPYTDVEMTAPMEEAVLNASFLYGHGKVRVNVNGKS